jgi:release factor glutamine methyltransferase
MTIRQAKAKYIPLLKKITPTSELELDLLLAKILGESREFVLTHDEFELSPKSLDMLDEMVKSRLSNKPISQILGYKDFWRSRFKVTDQILTPRPDTEMLVLEALKVIRNRHKNISYKILDLCTGSGNISISLVHEMLLTKSDAIETIKFTASDISNEALVVARENYQTILANAGLADSDLGGAESMIEFIQSDLFENISGTFDLIICNPPYLPEEDSKTWMPELDFEPKIALTSGQDGLELYHRIIESLSKYLEPGGTFLGEIDPRQVAELRKIVEQYSELKLVKFIPGLSGEERFLEISRSK